VSTSGFKLVHVSPRVQARGGVEALHLHHREWSVPQHFVALFDRDPGAWPNYTNLNFTWRTPLWKMRRVFRRELAAHAGSVVIYHHVWGLPLFHDVDAGARRIAYCLGMPSYHEADLTASTGLVDGAMGITPSLDGCWRRTLPELAAERRQMVPVPVVVPEGIAAARDRNDEIVLGYAGRLERRHKRVDRLPELVRALRATGRKFRFEVLGDGVLRETLQKELGGVVTFHGWTTKDEFWRVMSRWDAVVFFSEMEGGPIALLEGCALGAIPFFPAIGDSLGDLYAPRVDELCHYRPGDMQALARNVDRFFARPKLQVDEARARARAAVSRHLDDSYRTGVLDFAARVAELPRISTGRSRRARV
jgi:glycosyltransferase involved in cell wall biosynthesis